ncbi:IQ domain-containing protein C isoform X2 [Pleurodeles waltl]|uniref:IQ domain-containing protein C isoform X2 n=1 Tax=Pleurodeles waltl TaxID=8319 RepID=UPI00370978FA
MTKKAHVRGFLVRRRFQRLQQEYSDIVQEIEGSSAWLSWTRSFMPRPQFSRAFKGHPLNEQKLVSEGSGILGVVQDLHCPSQTEKSEKEVVKDADPLCQLGTQDNNFPQKDEDVPRLCQEGDAAVSHQDRNDPGAGACERTDWLHCSTGSSDWTSSFAETEPNSGCRALPLRDGGDDLPRSLSDLRHYRSHLAMEMLWLQQAIASRKNYLILKQRLGTSEQ